MPTPGVTVLTMVHSGMPESELTLIVDSQSALDDQDLSELIGFDAVDGRLKTTYKHEELRLARKSLEEWQTAWHEAIEPLQLSGDAHRLHVEVDRAVPVLEVHRHRLAAGRHGAVRDRSLHCLRFGHVHHLVVRQVGERTLIALDLRRAAIALRTRCPRPSPA